MTTLELYTKREKMPCEYSEEEIRARADKVAAIYDSGDKTKFISHDDVFKRYLNTHLIG